MALVFAAIQYPGLSATTRAADYLYESATEAVAEAKAAEGTTNEIITKEYAQKQLQLSDRAIDNLARLKRDIIVSVITGVVAMIIGAVLWIISRKQVTPNPAVPT